MNFQSQKLTVDYIDLNIPKLSRNKLRETALYLLNLGFNSKEKKSTGNIVDLFDNKLNNYQVLFVEKVYNPKQKSFWNGFIVSFSGENASWLYSIIRKNQLDWEIFDSEHISLERFDINYLYQDRDYFSYQTTKIFLRRCQEFIGDLPRKRWTRLEEDPKKNDLILKICKRGNPNYQRMYFKPEGLKFELELRKYKAKQFQHWLFENRIQEFENQITEHFFKRWSQLLPTKDSSLYTNWILDFQRKNNAIKSNGGSLVINYLNSKNLSSYKKSENIDNFYMFLQFLSYLRELKISKSIILNGQVFYKIKFPLSDFLTYIGIDSKNNYQHKKLIRFLDTIQDHRLFEICFNEDSFRGSVSFPSYRIFKQNKLWVTELYIAEELYGYRYPFNFNRFFLSYRNKYDLIVKLEIVNAFSQKGLLKVFDMKDLLQQHKRSSSQLKRIRENTLECFNFMKQKEMIEPRLLVTVKDQYKHYIVEESFSLEMFLKADSIIFTERLI